MEQLVHLSLSPHRSPFPQLLPLADNKDNHLRFPSWLIFSGSAPERPERRCLIFHAERLSAHHGPRFWGGGPSRRTTCHTHTRGDRFVQSGSEIWGGNECEIIHPVWCNCGWGEIKAWMRVRSDQMRSGDGCYHMERQGSDWPVRQEWKQVSANLEIKTHSTKSIDDIHRRFSEWFIIRSLWCLMCWKGI